MKDKDSDMIYQIVRKRVLEDRQNTMDTITMERIRYGLRWWVVRRLDQKVTDFLLGWVTYDFLKSKAGSLKRLEVSSRILEEL